MNRISLRVWSLLLFVTVLLGGFGFFLSEYFTKGSDWVIVSGSPHVYNGENIGCGIVVDRDNTLLVDLNEGRQYSDSVDLRKATVHWIGDRYGSISAPALSQYAKEMAGFDVAEQDREEVDQIIKTGYGYGLQEGKYIGHLEYEYWILAQPLRRIIESKVRKVGSGFYGDFAEYGLYIFCKDDLTEEEVILTMEYTSDLQRNLDVKYSKMYLSLIDKLYVCDLTQVDHLHHPTKCTSHDISRKMCKEFFLKAL